MMLIVFENRFGTVPNRASAVNRVHVVNMHLRSAYYNMERAVATRSYTRCGLSYCASRTVCRNINNFICGLLLSYSKSRAGYWSISRQQVVE